MEILIDLHANHENRLLARVFHTGMMCTYCCVLASPDRPGKDAQVSEGHQGRVRWHCKKVHSLRDIPQQGTIAATPVLSNRPHGNHHSQVLGIVESPPKHTAHKCLCEYLYYWYFLAEYTLSLTKIPPPHPLIQLS